MTLRSTDQLSLQELWDSCVKAIDQFKLFELCFHPTCHTQPEMLMSLLSPLSCGCVLAMIHFTRQHFIRALRENRGFCHFPESFTLPGAGSTPLASPSRLPSTTLPSAWREGKGGDEGGRGGSGREFSTKLKLNKSD